ncbi:MAG: hypothetical protein Q7Q73_15650 [Verrucomicrobiota bacterium JB024]|nr:hypothetical protein [Verrucomicrobiota bacterium JB024]
MAIVLEANYCKKLGLPGYSSHQYGVTIRAELGDINQVPEESERVYRLLQSSVDRELQQTGWLPQGGQPQPGAATNTGSARSRTPAPHSDDEEPDGTALWACSDKQRGLILIGSIGYAVGAVRRSPFVPEYPEREHPYR